MSLPPKHEPPHGTLKERLLAQHLRPTKQEAIHQLKPLMDAFILDEGGEKGPWPRLMAAQYQLRTLLTPVIPTSMSHRPGIDANALGELLINHRGLRGEFGNGPEQKIEGSIRHPISGVNYAARVSAVICSFHAPSQVSRLKLVEGSQDHAHQLPKETKLQAIDRMEHEIRAWLETNRETLPAELPPKITAALDSYHEAAIEVHRFVEDTSRLLKVAKQPIYGYGVERPTHSR